MTLPAGTEAFALVEKTSGTRSRSGKRSKLEGAARVKIIDYHDGVYHTEVLQGSGVVVGSIRVYSREELFATRQEREYFGELVGFLWGGVPVKVKRPPIEGE